MVKKKPEWLKAKLGHNAGFAKIEKQIRSKGLHTVCAEAQCPNQCECWRSGTATFMVLGGTCTRACRFCAIKTSSKGDEVDTGEPFKLAQAVRQLGIKHLVLTMVDRDDLQDGGAKHIASCIKETKRLTPSMKVEALVGDFQGKKKPLETILASEPDVFGHNLEVVERLQPKARDSRASYKQSLKVLEKAKELSPKTVTKSSLMVGLGETTEEVIQAMKDIRKTGAEIITLGQYLQPSPKHLQVEEYVHPQVFWFYEKCAFELGFKAVASGPLVRSSYKAGELFQRL